ncbi:hypothetical protein L6164_002192 [Bauhinia variegata]|uniref:Uncharacterized protein n=1 Tax=Bauhinia variegata TaxID=167791 RepID=A0ACB9PXF2_BAUVA|nr:hypothetical protein L6164_002192 [Bauhinia variegata]
MTTLELCGSNLKILPECIQACKNLQLLNLNNCKQLREIRGIPPNMEELSAINCTSLVPSVLNLLLNQNMHSCSGKKFTLPGTRIPEWVDHNGKGASLSFWFRNDFPNIALFGIGGPNSNRHECRVSINGHVLNIGSFNYHWSCKKDTEHIYLYDRPHLYNMDYPQDQWNHAEISYEFKMLELGRWTKPLPKETWVYIYDKARIKRDILFTNPNLNLNPEPSKEHLERKYQFLD